MFKIITKDLSQSPWFMPTIKSSDKFPRKKKVDKAATIETTFLKAFCIAEVSSLFSN